VGLPVLRPLPRVLFLATVGVEACAVVLSWGLEPLYDTLLYAVFSSALVGTGALILSRYPRHLIGWLLAALGLVSAVTTDLAQGWGLRAASEGWLGGPLAEWVATASWLLQAPALVLILLLFPTGRLPAPRWKAVVWASVVGAGIAQVGWALNPDTGQEFIGGRNPYAVDALPTETLFMVGFLVTAASMVAASVALVGRFRRSTGVERQQMKWFALSSGVLVLTLSASGLLWYVLPLVQVLPAVALTLWPVSIGIALLRYRLYDVDVVISRTFTYVVLSVVLAVVFAGAVVTMGALGGRGSPWATASATLVAAAAFKLLHGVVQERVDRRFQPVRQSALDRVTAFLDDVGADRAEPEQVVDVLRAALGDPRLELQFVLQPEESPVDERGRPVRGVSGEDGEYVDIRRGGVPLGRLVWHPVDDAQRSILPAVLDAAMLAIEMARLRVELHRRLDEVEMSRARISAAAADERRRIERDLHDGAQQRLVSIGLALRHAQHQLGSTGAEVTRTLDGAIAEIGSAIDELRELARGLQPTLLHAGLGPALRELAGRAPLPVEVAVAAERFAVDVEAAAYFVACEGLTNAVKHARAAQVAMTVARHDSRLVVTVADDGVGGAQVGHGSGLTGLSDRVAAQGGTLHIESVVGRGTRLVAELPCAS
jgi:signal transduction histidine kinase